MPKKSLDNTSERFSPSFFTANRAALRQRLAHKDSIVLLPAHSRMQRSRDTDYPFRQESNFWYLTGIIEPDYLLVITAKKTFLIAPKRSEIFQTFEGAPSHQVISAASGIDEIYTYDEGWQLLWQLLGSTKTIYVKQPVKYYHQQAGLTLNAANYHLVQRVKRKLKRPTLANIMPQLAHLRSRKQPAELAAIKQAIGITTEAFHQVFDRGADTYSGEYDIATELTHIYLKHRAVHGYEPIVAAGAHACTLHYRRNDAVLPTSNLLLIDSGAEVSGYSADITRMFSLGRPSQRQRDIYKAVYDLQQEALSLFRPGVSLRDIEERFLPIIGKRLKQLSLISSAVPAEIRKYYPHALSHFLGLDVHDVGGVSKPLAAGMVLTVEPGIYIPEEGIGVRLEDNIVITDAGYENLSAACRKPKRMQ